MRSNLIPPISHARTLRRKMAEILLGGKRLTELKVAELKAELEKRGMQKKGVKSVLIERLKKAILHEALTTASSAENTEEEEEEGGETSMVETSLADTSTVDTSLVDTSAVDSSTVDASTVDTSQTDNEPETGIMSPPARGRKKKRRSRKWSASKGEAPAPPSKEEHGGETQSSATEVPPASDVQEPEVKPEEPIVEEITVDTGDDVGQFVAPLEVDEPEIDVSAPELEPLPPEEPTAEVEQNEVSVEVSIEEDVSEIDVEGTPPVQDEPVAESAEQPMELATPPDTDIEVHRDHVPEVEESDKVKEKDGKDNFKFNFKLELESDSAFSEKMDDLCEQPATEEGVTEVGEKKALEWSDSVQIDPSYQPDNEELLYEGDLENEPEIGGGKEEGGEKKEDISLDDGKEDGFIVDLHGDSMEIDDGPKEAEKKTDTTAAEPGEKSQPSGGEAHRKPATTKLSRPPQCHLWVSGLVPTMRALDLQTLFSPFGQVVSAKVVAKARSRTQYRFGYVTMATPEQAQRCIRELNNTELKGKTINVEVAKSQPPISRQSEGKNDSTPSTTSASSGSPRASTGGEKEKEKEKEKGGKEEGTPKGTTKVASKGVSKGTSKGEKTEKVPISSPEKPRRVSEKGEGSKAADHKDSRSKDKSSSQKRSRSRSRERRRRSSPIPRRVSSTKRRSHSPPHTHGRIVTHHSHTPHTRSPHNPMRGDARHEIMRREYERRVLERRLGGGDPYLRERERQVELRLEERRLVHDRHQEMLIRRQLQVEHTRREQDMMRRMQESREREARERELRERQLAEQERAFKERERELREREFRERQRRELLERELREREAREREIREREKRIKEQHERELRERDAKTLRERELREKVQADKERELRERERRLLAEQERIERERRLHLEQQRRLEQERARAREREEQEQREMERKLKEERDQQWQEQERRERQEQERRERQEQERRERQDQERRERERRDRVEEERAKREREQKREREELERERMLPHPPQQRLGKRPFGTDVTSYESVKRQAVHDIRGTSEGYSSPSSVFGRLDPPTQSRSDTAAVQPLMGRSSGGDYRRGEQDRDHSHPYERSRSNSGSTYRTAGYSQAAGRERHAADGAGYPVQVGTSRTVPQTANVYGKVMSGLSAGSGVQQVMKQRQASDATALSRVPTDIINAATQALENIRKSVASAGGQVPVAKLSPGMRVPQVPAAALPTHLQQLAASAAAASSHPGAGVHDFLSGSPRVSMLPGRQGMMPVAPSPGGGSVIGKYSPQVKLPPEEERYNNPRRFSRPGSQQGRPSTYKRLI